jgi:serine/threonine-protein kinase
MDATVADSLLGTLIDGRYRVRARVARGGMATVYSAVDERLERTVALKVIHPAHARDPHFLDRFTDEAKAIARLTHPNVVAVYDQGTHNGLPYLVMEYVRGRTLRELLAERRRLSPQEALAVLEQMLAAIAAAHRAGLVHRDVKPENVLVAEAPRAGSLVDGVVKVADFGLARAVEASADDADGQQLMATVAYVAPELVTEGHADPRSDVYSAGIVLFEMLTGRVPYEAERPVDVAWQHVDRDVPPPSRYVPGLPEELDELVARATRRDPGGRPTDAGALLAEASAVRQDVGQASGDRLRADAQPTVVVPQVESAPRRPDPGRPSWARLPTGPQPRPTTRRRRAAPAAPTGGLRGAWERIVGDPRGRMAVAAAVVALGVLAAVGGWWFGVGRYTEAPTLERTTRAQAVAKAAEGGFTLRFDGGLYDERIPKDTVLRQRPRPGERLVGGGTITVTLSLGPERYAVPDVVGKAADLAQADLERIRLVPIREERFDNNIPAGSVVETKPPVGTSVKPGSQVALVVSKGRAPITMPNVVGKDVDAARRQLEQLGVSVAVKNVDSTKPRNQVVEQTPPDGSGVDRGASVVLTVSNGPPEVQLPDVVGRSAEEAKAILEQAGMVVAVTGPGGTVRTMFPPAGTKVPPGSTVTLFAFL